MLEKMGFSPKWRYNGMMRKVTFPEQAKELGRGIIYPPFCLI
jgi:predicted DNA-binding transcriptional regulator AlpA